MELKVNETTAKYWSGVPMVGYAYVPYQMADMANMYSAEKGLDRGTLYPELDKPWEVYGMEAKR